MFVRVYDKEENRYYKSMVYGLLDSGYYEKAILFNPYQRYFELVECVDKSTKDLNLRYECINADNTDWIKLERTFLLKLKKYFKEHQFSDEIQMFRGYKEVFDDLEFMLKIMRDGKVYLNETIVQVRDNEDVEEWNYIRNQKDANEFMHMFAGFHDSTIDKLLYEEDYGKSQIKMLVDNSGWYGVVELCFEGLIALNLRPPKENCMRNLYDATLLVNDESVFWANRELEKEDLKYGGTYIKAMSLKWRDIREEVDD